ncbi:cobalamin B12-binding domain-containing protein [Deferrisoma camini]|uniref:cobalamin B12-binding domain-containing protein n=1 Tax=Deferrisoma camini TaxID=1035120 RepID=UPI00046D2CE4|nr:cobalamin B12-binding domain-containing protein [Deferrisoma camini]
MKQKKVRVLIAKPGLDGHDRGAKVVARFLQENGYEVIYTGLHQSPEQIVNAALQEAVDAIGISVLSGSHNYVFPEVMKLLKERGMDDVVVFGGGTIPEEDIPPLLATGVKALFRPGTPLEEVLEFMKENVG